MPRLFIIVLIAAATFLSVGDASAEKRVALVIGNATYANAGVLRNPRNDATDMAATLKKLGFDVTLGLDLDQPQFAATVDRFARQLDDADVALFFYAGHGLQINDKNYLVSVNARLTSEFLVSSETIELDAIVNLMESKVPVNLVFLDACRNNPLADNLRKNLVAMKRGASLGRGLARIEPTRRDTLVAFAAAPGQEAADGSERNSPFTGALLKYLPKPDLEVSVMLKFVAAAVGEATHNMQRPQQLSDMTRTFYFANASADGSFKDAKLQRPSSSQPSAGRAAAPSDEDRQVELAFWNSAQAANDCEAMRAYQQRFPKGVFIALAALAERRLCSSRHVTVLEAAPGGDNPMPAPPPTPAAPGSSAAALQKLPPSPSLTAPAPNLAAPAPTAPVAPSSPMLAPPPVLSVTPPVPSPTPSNQQTAFINPTFTLPPSAQRTDQAFRDCPLCPEMVSIPGGPFDMGSSDDPMEGPIHRVTVKGFAVGRYPVKIGEWKQCVAARACRYNPAAGDDNLPVYNISWDDAQEYVSWLSRTTNAKYRLPTEAEWEYAARGRTATKYWWGNQPESGKAGCRGCGSGYSGEQPMKVGLFAANGFGLFDMTGSIDQWVSDCWNRNYTGAPRDGSSWDRPNCRQHVLRGGSWKNDVSYSRTSSRDSYDTDVRYPTHGLRVVRNIQE
jgi:formylglycine-generating enzyme required for sulfatase activity